MHPSMSGGLEIVIDGENRNRYKRFDGQDSQRTLHPPIRARRLVPGPRLPMRSFRAQRVCLSAGLVPFFLLAMACGTYEGIVIDHRFSYNVARVPPQFPKDLQTLLPMEREVFFRYGRPDFSRIWWREDGSFIRSSDLSGRGLRTEDTLSSVKTTWIYLYRDTEIEFLPGGGYRSHPLSDRLRLTCLYGDPSSKNFPTTDAQGRERESWIWYDHRIRVELLDGMIVKQTRFSGFGQGTDLGK